MIWWQTVSYTHLDVYKRQALIVANILASKLLSKVEASVKAAEKEE